MATKKQILLLIVGLLAGLLFLVYGFTTHDFGNKDNCWSHYTTENQAILNCEGEN